MTISHPLDRPVWSALTTLWSPVAAGDAHALRLDADHGPFGAAADGSEQSLAALAALIPADGALWTVEADPLPLPPGVRVLREAVLHQMTADSVDAPDDAVMIAPLEEADAADMRALAHLTVPGPFHARTHRLGRFLGVKVDGRIVAMAGERMRVPGFSEVSGVCTHPDHRGRGYAGTLMRAVARAMLERGETPFLHTYATNHGAIALYETLGFRLRMPMHMTVLGR